LDYYKKLVLITGGSKGIGLALAGKYADEGSDVFVLSRNKTHLMNAVKILEQHRVHKDQKFGWIKADVTLPAEIEKMSKEFIRDIGVPDHLVNCAGVAHPGRFDKLDLSIFYWMMDVNYFGTVITTKAFIKPMIRRGTGHVINVSSMGGVVGIYGYTAYSGSKFALVGFSDALRSELKLHGIKVSLALPPDTDTDQLAYENKIKPFITREVGSNTNLMQPETVAKTIMRGIKKGQYVILSNFDSTFFYKLQNLLGRGTPILLDHMIRQAIKKRIKPLQKAKQED
jgi:3-dehydrosphinganine reductase